MKLLFRAVLLGMMAASVAACHSESDANKTASATAADSAQMENAHASAADSVQVENPYARAAPPGQPNSASFMTLVNTSDVDHSLKSASSPIAATVELHTHTNNNGVMQMRKIPQIDIPAKGRVVLQPGGLHVMLIGLQQDMKVGETTQITLTFDDGSTTSVDAPIQEVTPPAGAGHMGGMMNMKN